MFFRTCIVLACCSIGMAAEKPRLALFPLAGDAKEELRDRAGFSVRAKLDRTGTYEVVDGPRMRELADLAKAPIGFDTKPAAIMDLGKLVEADVLVWGEMSNTDEGATMRLRVLDLREGKAEPRAITKVIKEPTDLRFVSEEILQTLKGVGSFEHPSEVAVQNDAMAEELWKKNPNLAPNPEFAAAGSWEGIYQAEKYGVQVSDRLPAQDKVVIYRMPGAKGEKANNVLAMRLSKFCAENNGLACLSDAIPIEADTRYRLSFRYRSDGPTLHVFVKGYTEFENLRGEKVQREIYRRQVPVTGATGGKWVTIVDELNPQQVAFPVQTLRIDLYAYLQPGTVMFDDIVLKAVGKQTRKAKDEAIDRPSTRAGASKP
jgi:hypothetical protein